VLLPYLTSMINASLREGHLPATQKHAILTPLLKKPYFDSSDLKNYRPVSNLAFISKVVERIIAQKLVSYLQEHDLLPRLQSAYRRHHSTETALLRVLSDIYAAADRKDVTLLGLLDLSAAFEASTASITTYSLVGCSSRSVSVERRYRGFSRSSTVALSRSPTMDSYRPSSSCYSACHRALFSAHSCSCCTQPSCSRSSRVPDLSDTRTPTTPRCTSVLQLHPRQPQLSASSAALNALTPG